jgi:hypothetical protein
MDMALGGRPRALSIRTAGLRTTFLCGMVAIPILAAMAGCSRNTPTGSVMGAVRFAGKPVATGRITFLCEGGHKPVFFADITDGVYRIEKAPVGNARVTIQAFHADASDKVPTSPATAPTLPGNTPPMPITAIPRIGKPIDGFPDRYLNPKTSGLTCEIKTGTYSQDFDLAP